MKKCVAAIFASLLAAPAPVVAQEFGAGDTIVVTATRTEIPIEDTTVPVTVIAREDIELSLATDLSELLRFEAGVDIGRSGGPGQATSIFLRGTESNHTLVLIDGVRINPGTIGGAAVQNIAPELIERVEIVKGARSALYGSDAIGGVINVITRRARQPFVEAAIGAGSFATQSGHLSAGDRSDHGELGLNVDWHSTDGFAPRVDSDLERGYDNLSVNLYGMRRLGASEISLRHWQSEGSVEYLDFFLNPVDQDFHNAVTAIGVDTQLGEHRRSKLLLSLMRDEIEQLQSPDFVRSRRVSVDWQYSHAFAGHKVTGGVYAVRDAARSLSYGSAFDEDTDVFAVFMQDQVSYGRHRGFVALRLTDHETFGRRLTWNAEYAFALNDALTLNAGIGHAFRAPDATDRFGFGGNRELDAELADEMQLGLRFTPDDRHRLDLELYATDIDELIEFDLATYSLQNVERARIRGVQLGYEYRGDNFIVHTNLVRQSANNVSTGARLLRRAEKSASFSYTHLFAALKLGVSVLANGERFDFADRKLPGFVLTNLTAQLQLSQGWQIIARIENVFDTQYQTAADYAMQGRSGFIELKHRWQ